MEQNPYEAPQVAVKRGGTRRIVGWAVLSLSTALTARFAWIGATWPNKSEAEWNRVYVLVPMGCMFMLVGCCLLYSAKRAAAKATNT